MLAFAGIAAAQANDTTTGVPQPPAPPPCAPAYHQGKTIGQMRKVYLKRLHVTPKARRHIKAMVSCQVGGAEATENMRVKRHRFKRKRHRTIWKIRFNYGQPAYERQWAVNTGACESHNTPTAHSSKGDHGAMQFKLGTWHSAGGTGDPHTKSLYEQYVRAIKWKHKTSDEQWPNCGD